MQMFIPVQFNIPYRCFTEKMFCNLRCYSKWHLVFYFDEMPKQFILL